MDETTVVHLVLHSTEYVHVPSAIRFAQNLYAAMPDKAIAIINDLFDGTIKEQAIVEILTVERLPVFDMEDFNSDRERYEIEANMLTERGLLQADVSS